MRKPYYKSSHKCWYFRDDRGKETRLDPDEAEAYRVWNQALAVQTLNDNSTFAVLAEAWLQEHQHAMKPNKLAQASGYLINFLPHAAHLRTLEVSKGLVLKWLQEDKPGRVRKDGKRGPSKPWAAATRKDAAGVIKRIYLWASHEGRISRNPLAGLEVPDGKPRTSTVNPEVHRAAIADLRKCIDDRPFALYLIASKCGARPRQIREVTAANVLSDYSAWIFDEHKTVEQTGRKLVVYLSPCLATLTRILAARAKPGAYLFTNDSGDQWKKDTVSQRMKRLRKRLKLPASFIAYAYRHTFATEALLSGVPIATVAQLLGHSDTRMVGKVYGHLDQHSKHLQDAAAQAAARQFKS